MKNSVKFGSGKTCDSNFWLTLAQLQYTQTI